MKLRIIELEVENNLHCPPYGWQRVTAEGGGMQNAMRVEFVVGHKTLHIGQPITVTIDDIDAEEHQ